MTCGRKRVDPHRTPHGAAATRARNHFLMSAGGDTRRVLGHLGINVPNLTAAQQYYAALLPLVGFEPFLTADDQFAFRPANGKPGTYLFFYPSATDGDYSPDRTGLQHLAFVVPGRSHVEAVHDVAVSHSNTVLYAPQHFPQYPGHYYATFWLDPFGLKLEAVCHHDRD